MLGADSSPFEGLKSKSKPPNHKFARICDVKDSGDLFITEVAAENLFGFVSKGVLRVEGLVSFGSSNQTIKGGSDQKIDPFPTICELHLPSELWLNLFDTPQASA